jgi:hypothetical protein
VTGPLRTGSRRPERPVTAPLALPGCHSADSESVTVTGSHRDGGTAVRHRDWQAAVCAPGLPVPVPAAITVTVARRRFELEVAMDSEAVSLH